MLTFNLFFMKKAIFLFLLGAGVVSCSKEANFTEVEALDIPQERQLIEHRSTENFFSESQFNDIKSGNHIPSSAKKPDLGGHTGANDTWNDLPPAGQNVYNHIDPGTSAFHFDWFIYHENQNQDGKIGGYYIVAPRDELGIDQQYIIITYSGIGSKLQAYTDAFNLWFTNRDLTYQQWYALKTIHNGGGINYHGRTLNRQTLSKGFIFSVGTGSGLARDLEYPTHGANKLQTNAPTHYADLARLDGRLISNANPSGMIHYERTFIAAYNEMRYGVELGPLAATLYTFLPWLRAGQDYNGTYQGVKYSIDPINGDFYMGDTNDWHDGDFFGRTLYSDADLQLMADGEWEPSQDVPSGGFESVLDGDPQVFRDRVVEVRELLEAYRLIDDIKSDRIFDFADYPVRSINFLCDNNEENFRFIYLDENSEAPHWRPANPTLKMQIFDENGDYVTNPVMVQSSDEDADHFGGVHYDGKEASLERALADYVRAQRADRCN